MENKFKDECDRLSTLEAQNHTSWGRWFVDDGMLSTWVVLPEKENNPVKKLYVYDFSVEKFKTKSGREEILNQISEKEWMGEKGIKDLKRAIKYFTKKGVVEIDNED
jgi:hypothetical protein